MEGSFTPGHILDSPCRPRGRWHPLVPCQPHAAKFSSGSSLGTFSTLLSLLSSRLGGFGCWKYFAVIVKLVFSNLCIAQGESQLLEASPRPAGRGTGDPQPSRQASWHVPGADAVISSALGLFQLCTVWVQSFPPRWVWAGAPFLGSRAPVLGLARHHPASGGTRSRWQGTHAHLPRCRPHPELQNGIAERKRSWLQSSRSKPDVQRLFCPRGKSNRN